MDLEPARWGGSGFHGGPSSRRHSEKAWEDERRATLVNADGRLVGSRRGSSGALRASGRSAGRRLPLANLKKKKAEQTVGLCFVSRCAPQFKQISGKHAADVPMYRCKICKHLRDWKPTVVCLPPSVLHTSSKREGVSKQVIRSGAERGHPSSCSRCALSQWPCDLSYTFLSYAQTGQTGLCLPVSCLLCPLSLARSLALSLSRSGRWMVTPGCFDSVENIT